MSTGDWITLGKFFLDSGTEYLSDGYVRHPEYLYEGRVQEWGLIDRSIPLPFGPPHIGDGTVKIADTDQRLRSLLSGQTARRRLFEIKIIQEGQSEASVDAAYVGEIVGEIFHAKSVELQLRDVTFSWFDKQIPGLGNRENFPDLAEGVSEFFIPIICGIVESVDPDLSSASPAQGQIALPHMGPSLVGDRWALAQHPIVGVSAVYRKTPSEGAFTLVDEAEYVITPDDPRTINGITYHLTFLDFLEAQVEGTEVRVDVYGIDFRGNFGEMASVSALSSSDGGPLRNPIDFLINMLYLAGHETRIQRYNVPSFALAREQFETLLFSEDSFGGTLSPYFCDGAITEAITFQEWLGRFLTSFGLCLYQNKQGRIEVRIPDAQVDSSKIFTGTLDILLDSLTIKYADPVCNRFKFQLARNYAENKWGNFAEYNNEADQLAIGMVEAPGIEEESVELWFVRDPYVATSSIIRRAAYLGLSAREITFDCPAPENLPYLELGQLIEVDEDE